MDQKKLEALARKNAAKAVQPKETDKAKLRKQYDSTLQPESEEALDLKGFFSDMKKREF